MKLKSRLKSVDDVKSRGQNVKEALRDGWKEKPRRSQESIDREWMEKMKQREIEQAARYIAAQESPLAAWQAGMGYQGPNMPDKGKKNGSCNVTACQLPLAGHPQFWMRDYGTTDGRLYYCSKCERNMTEWDMTLVARGENKPNTMGLNEFGYRCTPDEDNKGFVRVAV